MKFIDFFSGIGGFTHGLQLAGHECVGHCEFDKFAEASYRAMHTITDRQREYLSTITLKQRQKEILRKEYLNEEWYEADIKSAKGKDMPAADIWTFGAPCQDFSIAGKRQGLDGERSSLVREIFRLLEEREKEDRPEWLIYENVKGMLSSNRGLDFLSILAEMDRLGYDCEWQIINSRWWVPQNRERVYTVGHFRGRGERKIFPIAGTGGENYLKQIIPGTQGRRVYDNGGLSCTLNGEGGGLGANTGLYAFGSNKKAEGTAVAIPVLTPERAKKRQNGRRFKENGEPSFTLTTQDIHGVAIDLKALTSKTRGQPYRYGYAACLDHDCYQAVMTDAVWSKKNDCYLAIRKLTPRECFRLQGWTDKYFERAEMVNSNSQLYKQAGNGVTVVVVATIGKKLCDVIGDDD